MTRTRTTTSDDVPGLAEDAVVPVPPVPVAGGTLGDARGVGERRSGAAGIMAQVAMQQTMDEIIDYLATIDEKLDDVLRAQEDAV